MAWKGRSAKLNGKTAQSAGRGTSAGATPGPKKPGRVAQIRQAYRLTRKADPQIPWILLAAGFLTFAVILSIGFLVGHPIYLGFLGLLLGMLVMTVIFGRRAERAAYQQIEGQPGAAAAALNSLRRGWTVTPAVAVSRQQDVVHRAVGRPGVVLVAEGAPQRLPALLAQERRKLARLVPDIPVTEFQAGSADGQVPLRKLNAKLTRLSRSISVAQVAEVNRRLKAAGGMNVPIPKGPMPRGGRMPRSPRG
jgi:hypothetical protein